MKTQSSIQNKVFEPKYWSKTTFKRNSNQYIKQTAIVEEKRLPEKIVIQPTQREDLRRNGAEYVAHDGRKIGEYLFFTGLIPINNQVFFGNHVLNGKRSLLIFKFSEDALELSVFYLRGFYIDDRPTRIEFVKNFLSNH